MPIHSLSSLHNLHADALLNIDALHIPPIHHISGAWRIPGSKSLSNRFLLLAALSLSAAVPEQAAQGIALQGLLESEDSFYMLQCLRALGVECLPPTHSYDTWTIRHGITQHQATLFVGNAGTVMRPLTAVLTCLGGDYTLSGVPRMHERPIHHLVDALRQLGARIDYLAQDGYPPLRVQTSQNTLSIPPVITMQGHVSSQFISSLLLALPLLAKHATQDIVLKLEGDVISAPYIAMTVACMRMFGVDVDVDGAIYRIAKHSFYQAPARIEVEADASSASYAIAAGVLGGSLQVLGLPIHSLQGDMAFIDAVRRMGGRIHQDLQGVLHIEKSLLTGGVFDCKDIPDAAMTLAILALFAQGRTILQNIGSWKVKETDRIAAMQNELRKLGAQVESSDDSIAITPPTVWHNASIHTYDDHRMAMCFSLCAFSPNLQGITLEDPGCVRKTYPGYFADFAQLINV